MNGLTEVVMRRFIPSSIVLILFKVFFFLRLLFILLTLVCRNKSRWWWCFFFFSFDFGFTLRQFFGSRQRRRLWRPPVHLSDVWPRTKNVFMKKGLKRSKCRSFHDVWVSNIDFRARERERERKIWGDTTITISDESATAKRAPKVVSAFWNWTRLSCLFVS